MLQILASIVSVFVTMAAGTPWEVLCLGQQLHDTNATDQLSNNGKERWSISCLYETPPHGHKGANNHGFIAHLGMQPRET